MGFFQASLRNGINCDDHFFISNHENVLCLLLTFKYESCKHTDLFFQFIESSGFYSLVV